MPETCQARSISRTLLLPSELQGTIRLRYQLAEDGCKESQVALAKCLLTSPVSSLEERNTNAQLAVYWLLLAANKGQEEAIVILKDCANAGIGINTRNSFEVEKCLKLSDTEVLSRKVAFSIFHAIMSDTEDILTEETFREKIEKILQEDSNENLASLREDTPSPLEKQIPKVPDDMNTVSQSHVSFSGVVHSVQNCLEGNVPFVSLKQVADFGGQKKGLLVKYISVIWNLLSTATEDFVRSFSALNVLIAVSFLYILSSFIYRFSTPGTETHVFLHSFNLNLATVLCLLTSLSSTCFVICISFGVENIKKWLHLINFFEPNVKSYEVEKKYLMKTAYPLFTFFIVSFIYLILLPLNSIQKCFTDVGVLAVLLMLLVDRSISHQRYYVNISFFLNLLTCLYKSNILQKLSLSALNYLNLNIIYEVGSNYQIHLNFISCLGLPFVLPYLYFKMALGNELKGWHLVLLPHLMSVMWMNLACFHLADVDTTNLFYSICTCFVIMLLSRYFGFVVTFTIYALVKSALVSGYINFQLLLILPVFLILYFSSAYFVKKLNISNESKLCSLIICVLVVILSYQAACPQSPKADLSDVILPWDKYQTHCHHHSWYRTNPAEVQIKCLPFKGRKISLEGSVTAIEIIHIKNNLQIVANFLPSPFYDWFVCAVGKRYETCESGNILPAEKEKCLLYETLNISHCHLHNWDEYTYQIVMEVSTRSSPEILLISNHVCSTFIRSLKEGDFLRTVGVLESNIGGSLPKLSLAKAQCNNCYTNLECNTAVSLPKPNYSLSLKNIIWFYLSPFFQYRLG